MSRLAGRAMPRVGSAASWSYDGISSTPAGTDGGADGWRRQLADQAGADRGQDRHADQRDRGGGGPGPADPVGPGPDQGGEVGRRPVGALGERLGRLDPHPARVGVGGAGPPALTRAGAVALGRPGPALPAQAALQQGGGGGLGAGRRAAQAPPLPAQGDRREQVAPQHLAQLLVAGQRVALGAQVVLDRRHERDEVVRNAAPEHLTQRPPAGWSGAGPWSRRGRSGSSPRRRSISERNQ